MPGQEFLLIRHGQSTANASGVWQGQMEFPLSEEGREQARLAGKALAGVRLDAIYSSPLGRALETAEIIARETGFGNPVVPLEGLMERRGGSLEGTTHAEREARSPEFTKKLLSLPEEERWTLVGAETDEEVLARFEKALSGIRARHADGERLVVVSHGGVMRAFLRYRFGPGVLPGAERAANASITRVEWEADEEPKLLEVASTRHLTSAPRASVTE
ncbi:MAG TPA: histidine phosphatase family protein [Rubrobacteraceae bacterium]|nr:histidine phosphatase family protein [Rubrobacteraceae bacterium]